MGGGGREAMGEGNGDPKYFPFIFSPLPSTPVISAKLLKKKGLKNVRKGGLVEKKCEVGWKIIGQRKTKPDIDLHIYEFTENGSSFRIT